MDYLKNKSVGYWLHMFTMPFIWLPLFFIIMLDAVCMLYQVVCFPIYGIKQVKREEYILVMDRNKLDYLNSTQKLGCMYCGYANGVLLYMKEISGLTEKYWCGIMHKKNPGFKEHEDQIKRKFAKYDDEKDFNKKYLKNK